MHYLRNVTPLTLHHAKTVECMSHLPCSKGSYRNNMDLSWHFSNYQSFHAYVVEGHLLNLSIQVTFGILDRLPLEKFMLYVFTLLAYWLLNCLITVSAFSVIIDYMCNVREQECKFCEHRDCLFVFRFLSPRQVQSSCLVNIIEQMYKWI